MKRCTNAIRHGAVYVVKTEWEGEQLVTFIGAHTQAEVDKEAERRLRILHTTGDGLWYRLTQEEIEQAVERLMGKLKDDGRVIDWTKEQN